MKKTLFYAAIAILIGSAVIYGCSKSGSSSPTPAPVTKPVATSVNIQNFAFSPDTLKVKPGTSVTWTNMDSAPHTATSLNGIFDSGSLSTGQAYSYTFSTAGTYAYHCAIHSMMKTAVIVVSN